MALGRHEAKGRREVLYFFNSSQREDNASFHKGVLFEELLKKYLEAAGYRVKLSRAKHASLEYDIEGEHALDGRPVIGEAKAHSDLVSGQQAAAFVGKALPFLHRTPPYTALFLTTSPLTPEASDYLETVNSSTPYRVVALSGGALEADLRSRLRIASREAVSRAVSHLVPRESRQHIVHTDLGTFVIITGAGEPGAFDDRFAVTDDQGTPVSGADLLEGIREHLQPFRNLLPMAPAQGTAGLAVEPRHVPEGLNTAVSWIDFRRPANEQFFVGRQEQLGRAQSLVENNPGGVVIEIKSKSGVGKSSVLAVLREIWHRKGHRVELHDARDVQSSTDVLRLFGRFAGTGLVASFEQVPSVLGSISPSTPETRSIFMVDQLESAFPLPEVFTAYEYLASCVARASSPCAFVYSRKDDLLTAHDEIAVGLDRLRSLSHTISIDDFTRDEASTLLKVAASSMESRVGPQVLDQALEFAQGFPWLLKRTMAHLARMGELGVRQEELISRGLHLEDLFEEEMAELDEHERGYLTSIAGYLPASYQALARSFKNDPLLSGMLEKLTSKGMLRFSAGTYDTYNDVLKDYILYERLPERAYSPVYRLGIVPVMDAFRRLGARTSFSPDEFSGLLGKSVGGTYSLLREMRLAGLVARSAGGWFVPEVVRQFEHRGRLGEYVRRSVLRNRVVADLMLELERSGPLKKDMMASWLHDKVPFVEAGEDVWAVYANRLIDWCRRLLLLRIDSRGILRLGSLSSEEAAEKIGNLELTGRGERPGDAAFAPSVPWTTAAKVLEKAGMAPLGGAGLRRSETMAIIDLKRVGALVAQKDRSVAATESVAVFQERMHTLFSKQPYSRYWELLRKGVPWDEAMLKAFGFVNLTKSTRRWLGKRLANWGRQLGFLDRRRLKLRRSVSQQMELW
jgi:hypothetical protein